MDPITKYFNAEKAWCCFGLCVTIFTAALALYWLIKVKQPFYNGMSYPFLFFGIGLMVICIGVIYRSPKDIVRVEEAVHNSKAHLQMEEIPRMKTVMRNFNVIITVEMILIAASVVLFFVVGAGTTWRGVVTGIFLYAAFLLLFDLLARERGKEYLNFLAGLDT